MVVVLVGLQMLLGPAVVGRQGPLMVHDGSWVVWFLAWASRCGRVAGCVSDPGSVGVASIKRCDVNPGSSGSWSGDGDFDRWSVVILLLELERKGVPSAEGAAKVRHVRRIISSCFGFESGRLVFWNALVRYGGWAGGGRCDVGGRGGT